MRNWFARTFLEYGDRWLLLFDLITLLAEEAPAIVPVVLFHLASEVIVGLRVLLRAVCCQGLPWCSAQGE